MLTSGELYAMGKGSYGRLGLGDSTNHSTPQRVRFADTKSNMTTKMVRLTWNSADLFVCKSLLPRNHAFRQVSSSKGSDGHTLAVSTAGQLFSWGDGDFGKLGHGNTSTQKLPKQVLGPLEGKVGCITGLSGGTGLHYSGR